MLNSDADMAIFFEAVLVWTQSYQVVQRMCQSVKMTVLDIITGHLCSRLRPLNSNSDHRRCCASLEWLVLFVVR